MRRLALLIAVLVALAAGGLAITGTGPFAGVAGGASPSATIGPVPASDSVSADGAVVPVRWAALSPAAGGRVVLAAAEGATVQAGDVVLGLDTAQADAAIAVAAAAIPVAEAQAAQATASVTQASRSADAAVHARDQAKAGLDAARAQRDQVPSGASKATKRAADANIRAARAAYRAAVSQWQGARAAVTAAGAAARAAAADVERARAGLAQAQVGRSQLEVQAPFAGVVSFAAYRVGELASPGVIGVRVGDPSAWRIETSDLDETSVARIRVGSAVEISLDAYPGQTTPGVVREIGAFGETHQGDIVYRVLVEPTTSLPAGVRWNMTASVTISTK